MWSLYLYRTSFLWASGNLWFANFLHGLQMYSIKSFTLLSHCSPSSWRPNTKVSLCSGYRSEWVTCWLRSRSYRNSFRALPNWRRTIAWGCKTLSYQGTLWLKLVFLSLGCIQQVSVDLCDIGESQTHCIDCRQTSIYSTQFICILCIQQRRI